MSDEVTDGDAIQWGIAAIIQLNDMPNFHATEEVARDLAWALARLTIISQGLATGTLSIAPSPPSTATAPAEPPRARNATIASIATHRARGPRLLDDGGVDQQLPLD